MYIRLEVILCTLKRNDAQIKNYLARHRQCSYDSDECSTVKYLLRLSKL